MNIDYLTPGDEPNDKTIYFVCINCWHRQEFNDYCEECESEELIEDNEC